MSRLSRLVFLRKKYTRWNDALCKAMKVPNIRFACPKFLNHLEEYNEVSRTSLAVALDDMLLKNGGTLNESLKKINRNHIKRG